MMSHLLLGLVLIQYLVCGTFAEVRQLPYCKDGSGSAKPARSLLFVSTLDGKLTALDAAKNGQKIWSLDFKTEPLLSSNIHRRDLNNNGQWVRLIPALNGGLYKFDGENLESVPVSVDQLLQSSFRYSDDLIFSGGKETKTYGIVSSNGKILYECKMNSCANSTGKDNLVEEDVLIVRRHQHTIRASEPRSGVERWNFSVGLHDLTIIPRANIDCNQEIPTVTLEIDIRAIVPEGLVVAFSKTNPSVKLWEYKFESPVVTVWREDQVIENGITPLKEVNLFDSSLLDTEIDSEFSTSPGLYIGMHDRQLYIQENPAVRKTIDLNNPNLIKYPWRPYPAIESSIDVDNDKENMRTEMSDIHSSTALSVLYNSEYVNGNGFYLYSKEQMQLESGNQCNGTAPKDVIENASQPLVVEENLEAATPIQVIYVYTSYTAANMWQYWFQILVISIAMALVIHYLFAQKTLYSNAKDAVAPPLIVERHVVDPKNESRLSQSEDSDGNFKSRYMTDYDPVDCLGRGGYGVVFEARNKLDDCNYAIKRIALPNSRYSRERVMREVKALAKLDHHNIVRYFSAWLECPPAGWQEEHDQRWLNHEKFPNSNFTSESSAVDSSVRIGIPPSNQSSVDSARDALELNDDNDDSFIVFDNPSNDEEDEDTTEPRNTESVHLSISDSSKDDKSSEADDSIVFEETKHTDVNASTASHSIVFEESKNSDAKSSEASHSIAFEKSKQADLAERKSQMNLDLRKRKDSTKSDAKMFLYIQMQLCQRLSLREWLKSQNSKRESFKFLNIFEQIVDAVEYVHLQGMIHRDLKPSNIFFSFDNKIKIGDFGLVTAMTEGINGVHTPCNANEISLAKRVHTARVGTHLYMSPEQMNGKNYNYKVDIYSLGIILFELLIPFSTEMERVVALTNLRKSVFPENFYEQYPAEHVLIKMMLDENPEKRPTTLGIKAFWNAEERSEWHYELPPLSRHSSITNSSGSNSWEMSSQ